MIAEEVSLTQSSTKILFDRANQAYTSGNHKQAIAIWLKIAQKLEPQSHQLATVYSNLASVYWHTGKSGEAVKYWQQSIAIYREINPSSEKLAATLTDTARAYNDLGQPRFSMPLLTEAIALADHHQVTKVKDVAYLALGNAYMIQGKYSLAIDAYQQSLKKIEQIGLDLPVVVWQNLSKAYQQKAVVTRQEASALAEEGELSADRLWKQAESDRALAWQAANKAVKISENSQSLAQVEALIHKAQLAQNTELKSEAVASLSKAEAVLSALPDSYGKVYALIELGKLNQDSTAKSQMLLNSAVKIARKINNPRVLSFATGAMGKHYETQQQYVRALDWTKQAQFMAQQIQAADILYQWDWQAARIYQARDETDAAIESYQRAIASLQSIRSSMAQTQGDPLFAFQKDVEPVYRGLIQLLLSNNSDRDNLQQALQTQDLLLLSELENFFQDECFELETLTEANKLAYLKQTNTAVVNTIVLKDKTYLIWQFPDGQLKKYAVNISQAQLKQLLTQWRFDLENRENDNYLSLSRQLYQLLFSSTIQSDLKAIKPKNLIFVNDGILRNVPIAALHDGQKFLIENYAITNSLGLNIQPKQPSINVEKALAFGLSVGTEKFPPIPYVRREIKKLSELVDEKQFLNNEFSYDNFKQQVESSKSSIVHVATHGQFGGTAENTFLQAYKSQISLTELETTLSSHNTNFPENRIQLLVLSACDTAASNPSATLGMSGVAIRAGVSNVLGSLWAVNDQQIVALIDGFYSYWIRDGLSKSDALRQAQLDLIKSPNYHPSSWSSMILIQG